MSLSSSPTSISAHDSYDLSALDRDLAATPFAGKLHHFAEIGSTSTHAMHQAELGAPHGSVYIADAQTAGRGRGAHTWSSPPGSGLYVSVLLRPAISPGDALWFSLAAGLAALEAVHATTGLIADLRWPNDLLFGRRKFAGVLTEMQAEATRVRHMVIGIGINLHTPEFPAELAHTSTSLAIEGAQTTKTALLVALLTALARETAALSVADSHAAQEDVLRRLEAASSWIRGKSVLVDEGQSTGGPAFTGITAGLDARGFLTVQTADGLRTVRSGGVRAQED